MSITKQVIYVRGDVASGIASQRPLLQSRLNILSQASIPPVAAICKSFTNGPNPLNVLTVSTQRSTYLWCLLFPHQSFVVRKNTKNTDEVIINSPRGRTLAGFNRKHGITHYPKNKYINMILNLNCEKPKIFH
jgi:hypothetical protein